LIFEVTERRILRDQKSDLNNQQSILIAAIGAGTHRPFKGTAESARRAHEGPMIGVLGF
jgi:hypothetical protein